jgi:hypothetical protein
MSQKPPDPPLPNRGTAVALGEIMQTLIDLFEFRSSDVPAPKLVAAPSYDGRATLGDIDIDWEETLHGNANDNGRTEESGTFVMRGTRVWVSEE